MNVGTEAPSRSRRFPDANPNCCSLLSEPLIDNGAIEDCELGVEGPITVALWASAGSRYKILKVKVTR
jgi:hypothetical protein